MSLLNRATAFCAFLFSLARAPVALGQVGWNVDWWPDRTADDVQWIGWVLAAVGTWLVLRILLRYWRWWMERTRPTRLFMQVASATGLSAAEQWRLRRLAKSSGLSSPLTLLMSAATLEHHLNAAAEKMPATKGAELRRGFEGILQRMRS